MDTIGLKAILDDKNFQDGLHRYQSGIGQMEKSTNNAANIFSKAGSVMQGAFVAGLGAATVAIGAFAAASKIGLDTTLEWAEGLDKLGDQFGFSGEKASAFQYLANKVGVSIDEMGVGLNTFTRGLADMKNAQGSATLVTAKSADAIKSLKDRLEDANTKLARAKQNLASAKKPTDAMRYAVDDAQKAVNRLNTELGGATKLVPKAAEKASPFGEALKTLGVKAFDAKGKLRTFDDLLPELMDKFNKLPPGVKASELAMTLFGARGGGKFLDFLRQGSKGLEDAKKKAKELGLELSTDEVNAAEEFGFAVNELNLGLKGFWNQIGRQVLPIAKKFVDFVNDRIIPILSKWAKDVMPKLSAVLEQVGFIISDVVAIFTDFNRPIGDASNALEAFIADAASLVNIFGGNGTVVENAMRGIADAIGKIANAFKTGGLAGGLQEFSNQLGNAFKNIDWSAVSKNLEGLKSQFWTWLTGKGGVLEQVGTELGKVRDAMAGWLSNEANTKPIVTAILGWVKQFWAWVTDPKEGVIATVSTQMGELIKTMKKWSEDENTKLQFREIGKTIAKTVLEGIGSIFRNPGEGRNLIMDLRDTMDTAYQNLRQFFANIGTNIAHGIIEGIETWIFNPEAAAVVARAFDPFFNAVFTILSTPGGLIGILGERIVRALTAAISGGLRAFLQTMNPFANNTPATPPLPWGGTGEKFQGGGWVHRTGLAKVDMGEYVLNRQQAMQFAPMLTSPNNSRTYNFYHTWPAGVPTSQQQWTEGMVRRVTQQEMRGILGKG